MTCAIEPRPIGEASQWLADRQRLWNARLDALGRHLDHQSEIAPAGRGKR